MGSVQPQQGCTFTALVDLKAPGASVSPLYHERHHLPLRQPAQTRFSLVPQGNMLRAHASMLPATHEPVGWMAWTVGQGAQPQPALVQRMAPASLRGSWKEEGDTEGMCMNKRDTAGTCANHGDTAGDTERRRVGCGDADTGPHV